MASLPLGVAWKNKLFRYKAWLEQCEKMAVLLETSLGDIVVDLYTKQRPKTSLNFLKLCKMKYYNYCLFYSVQRNFIAQAGDPQGKGTGGQSVWGLIDGEQAQFFEAETVPRLKHKKTGTLSMANNGNDLHGSQFFFTLREDLDYLDKDHTVFGEVAEGLDTLVKINSVHADKEGRPFQDIRIYHTVVLDDPFDDPVGLVPPERSPSPPLEITDSDRIGAEEKIDEFEGKSEEEVKRMVAERESKANTHILEMIGDIPDADARPPENILFVCKLNSLTTAEDLEIIFSRFGAINSCEIIRDHKTGDSLQYGFIDFEKEEDCVSAYFKMDNVLIDDRRIHVDFCQSLAKVKHGRNRQGSKSSAFDGFMPRQQKNIDKYEMVFDDSELATQHSRNKNGGRAREERHRSKERRDKHTERSHRNRRSRSRSRERRRSRSRSRERRRRHSRSPRRSSHVKHSRHRSRSRERPSDRHSHKR